jgi:dolichol-phosphate mannosyltransferase
MDTENKKEIISVVVPVRDEEKNIPVLCERLENVLNNTKMTWEIIFIEDSSVDNTKALICGICKRNSNFKAIFLTRSFGHHEAFSAGIEHANGDHIVMMDGDLQHPPEVIDDLLRVYKQGYDMVYAKRTTKEGFIKQIGSSVINYLMNKLSDFPINLNSSIFRIFSRRIADHIINMPERKRFLVGMLTWQGYKTAEIEFEEHKRTFGKTKYSLKRMIELSMNAITSFTVKPLRFGIYIGFLTSISSFAVGSYYILKYLVVGIPVEGFTSVIVLVLLLSGVILFFLGIIGEYIGNIFTEIKGRPLYIIDKKVNLT